MPKRSLHALHILIRVGIRKSETEVARPCLALDGRPFHAPIRPLVRLLDHTPAHQKLGHVPAYHHLLWSPLDQIFRLGRLESVGLVGLGKRPNIAMTRDFLQGASWPPVRIASKLTCLGG